MDSLQEILGRRDYTPPDEVEAVKDYVLRRYKSKSYVKLQRGALIVSVPSSALAATLQLERQKLIDSCNIKQKLVIRGG